MTINTRELAYRILHKIDVDKGYANITVNKFLERKDISKADRSFITQIVYGVLRHKGTLDWVIHQFTKNKFKKIKPNVLIILRIGLYQIMFMDRVPVSAACNESAKLARSFAHEGIVKFVNGVLRNISRNIGDIKWPDYDQDPASYIAVKFSHPKWLVEKWIKQFGVEATKGICEENNKPATTWIRCNTMKTNRVQLFECLEANGVKCIESELVPEGIAISGYDSLGRIDQFKEGLFTAQDESSMIVGHVLAPKPETVVIDACSAPGGKTTHLAQLMQDKGSILAYDIHPHKIDLVNQNAQRLGLSSIKVEVADATELHNKVTNQVDYVLVDVPCSGTGVIGRRADARWNKTLDSITEVTKLQYNIITSASKCVKPGGVLVYSTCSIEPEENLELVERFLRENKNFKMENIIELLTFNPKEEDKIMAKKGYFQFLPHKHKTDGFFVCRLRKI
ncbi:16S rRNA (cytosine967-C5)-methyltransferase [Desulfitispora alkaliphila]|uniref:16S rRNA (cytosine(967)-C(5))-methyltransferase RsmB n=1 Tax=Desulfitispora alkaliphila TaxID=622674 RepID=UPI003D1DDAAE